MPMPGSNLDESTVSKLLHYYSSRMIDGFMSHDDYSNEVRKLAVAYPSQMQAIMAKNTDAKTKLLNTLEFDMDSYSKDPWSRAGISELPNRLQVALGAEGNDTIESGKVGLMYGANVPELKSTYFPGTVSKGTLRHEASHAVSNNETEKDVRTMDLLYALHNRDNEEYLRATEALNQDNVYPMQLLGLMDQMKQFKDNKMQVGNQKLMTGMPPDDQLNYLNTRSPTMLERFKGLFE